MYPEEPIIYSFHPDHMPLTLISVPGTRAHKHVRPLPVPMFARAPPVRARVCTRIVSLCTSMQFCRSRFSSKLLNCSSLSFLPPHSRSLNSVTIFPLSESHNRFSQFCHFARKPEFLNSAQSGLSAMFSNGNNQNRLVQMGFPCWRQFFQSKTQMFGNKKYHVIAVSLDLNP